MIFMMIFVMIFFQLNWAPDLQITAGEFYTVWGGRLSKRFFRMFPESSTGSWAELQLPCCPKKARGTSRKHVIKPFTQPATPDCILSRGTCIESYKRYPKNDSQNQIQGQEQVSIHVLPNLYLDPSHPCIFPTRFLLGKLSVCLCVCGKQFRARNRLQRGFLPVPSPTY